MRTRTCHLNSLAPILLAGLLSLQAQAQSINANASVQAAQAPLTAQERLDAIRQSLVDASLQTPTRVSTTTWLDPQGSLRENTSFKNSIDLRGVRVASYDRDTTGQAKARLQFPNNTGNGSAFENKTVKTVLTETGFKGAVQKFNRLMTKASDYAKELSLIHTVAPACTVRMSEQLNHVIDFGMAIEPSANHVVLQSLMPLLQNEWVKNPNSAGTARAWRAVNSLPTASMANTMTAYERALIGNRPETLPWQANLKISTPAMTATGIEGLLGQSKNSLVLNLDFQLVSTQGLGEAFEESVSLQIEIDRPAWSAPSLTAASIDLVKEQLQIWRAAGEQWLSCHAINPTVTAVSPQFIQINAGELSGVRKGDEWLVANPSHFPSELIGREGAPQTLLAKVQAVTPHNSQLIILAGPVQAVQADWRAWPTETLIKESSVVPASQRNTTATKRSLKTATNANDSFTLTPY